MFFAAIVSVLPIVTSPALAQRSAPPIHGEFVGAEAAPVGKPVERLDASLTDLARTWKRRGRANAEARARARLGVTLEGDTIEVILDPGAGKRSESISKKDILSVGGVVTGQSRSLLSARIPVARLEEAAAKIGGLGRIRLPLRPDYHSVTSEAPALTGATPWGSAGFDGNGVRVAVIDGGFNGLSAAVANGDIPADYVGRDESGTGLESGSYHGTAVAEAVCDMAPTVDLYCIKIENDLDFENAVDYCVAQGVAVVNHSMGWKGSSNFDGNGDICDTVAGAVASGILWVNSAGNEARRHCQATFSASGYTLTYDSVRASAASKPLTAFPETAYGPVMYVTYCQAGQNLQCHLTWDAWAESGQDYDLFLYRDGSGWIGYSIRDQTAGATPVEWISHTADAAGWYGFGVTRYSASRNHTLDLFVDSSNASLEVADAANRIAQGSLTDPAVSQQVLAVAAIDEDNWTAGPQESFSSQGPTNGGLTKPDISGPDDCDSLTYGPWKGTSQSSPFVAGAAALLFQAYPDSTNSEIRTLLEDLADDLGAAGKDNIYGWGKLDLGPPPSTVDVATTPQADFELADWRTTEPAKARALAFRLTDRGGDAQPLRIDRIAIPVGGSAGHAADDIAWAELRNDTGRVATAASITDTQIVFGATPNGDGIAQLDSVPDEDFTDYSVHVYLASPLQGAHGQTYVFDVDEDDIGADTGGGSAMAGDMGAIEPVVGTLFITELGIVVSPSEWSIGAVAVGDAAESTSFTVMNDGNVTEDISIAGTDGAGGWALSPTAGVDAFAVEIDLGGDGSFDLGLSHSEQTLATGVGVGAEEAFRLRYEAPTTDTVGGRVAQDCLVTLKAAVAP